MHAIALRAEIFRRADLPPPGVEPAPPYDEATLGRFAASLGVDLFRPCADGSPPRAGERLLHHLRRPPPFALPLRLLEALALGCFERSKPLADRHALRVALALAPHAEARTLLEGRPRDWPLRACGEGLLRRGVDESPGWVGIFLGRLDTPDDASIYEPSAPLARALFERGGTWWPAAERVLGALTGPERDEALGARAVALYLPAGAGAVIAALRAVPAGPARERALIMLARRAADRRRPHDVCFFAGLAAQASGRAALVAAAALGEAGERLEARRWLARVKGAHLAPWVELERTRLDLDAGLPARAAARLAALPRALLCPSREPAPWLGAPDVPGRPAAGFAAEALALRLELVVRRGRGAMPLALKGSERRALAGNHEGLVRLWRRVHSALRPETVAAAVADAGRALARALTASWVAYTAAEALRTLDAALEGAGAPPGLEPASVGACAGGAEAGQASPEAAVDGAALKPARAFLLGTQGDPAVWRAFRVRGVLGGPGDWARCCYDEGVSLSPARESHREALVRASRGVLREALRPGARASASVVASRLRCLTNLGAERAAASLERVLREAPGDGAHLRTAFLHLLRLSPARAGTLFLERPGVFYGGEFDADLARALEAKGVFEPRSADAWVALAASIARHSGEGRAPLAWLAAFGPLWLKRFGRPPGVTSLRALAAALLMVPMTPAEALAHLEAQRERIVSRPPGEFFDALTTDPLALSTLRALAPADDGSGGPCWDERRWRALLDRLRELPLRVDEAPVRRLARALAPRAEGSALVDALLEGRCPVPGGPWPLGGGGGDSLRYLDKRRDVLAFLRLADCVMCCFHSAGGAYGDPAASRVGNYRWVLALWCDPLSFCFHVTRGCGGEGPPVGFVFGSFGLSGSAPVLLLNGVYLRRQDEQARADVLACIEANFARPLGVAAVAVGNRYGGRGPLPRGYAPTPRSTLRLRALQDYAGTPVTSVYDDISNVTNATFTTEAHICWKNLR
ncbi:MAG TPA: hypothetical protein VFS43_00625 [Polyangiaceae bacterium]|nr:hypothetical protein [Polyangiaceae bacterium]